MFFWQDERHCLLRSSAASTRGPQSRFDRLCSRRTDTHGSVGPTEMVQAFKTACTRIEVRTPGLRTRDRGPDLLVPLPRPFGICLNAADGPMNARAGGIYSADGNAHTPGSTGRLDSVSSTDSSLALLLLLGAMMLPVSSRSLRILTSASASGLLAEEGCHPRIWP